MQGNLLLPSPVPLFVQQLPALLPLPPLWVQALVITLRIVTTILHTLGLYLLRCLFIDQRGDVEEVLIASLSSIEILETVIFLLVETVFDKYVYPTVEDPVKLRNYTDTFMVMISFIFYMNMVFITVNKVLQVWFNIKYSHYFNMKKAKKMIAATWFTGFLMGVCALVIQAFIEFSYVKKFNMYFRLAFACSYILIAITSFGYIFRKYRCARLAPTSQVAQTSSTQENVFTTFWNSRFRISTCLALTFLLFIIIPDVAHPFLHRVSAAVGSMFFILANVGNLSVCIYVFCHSQVRRLLVKRLSELRHMCV